MAANVPAKLKPAGITPYVLRANQLRQAKPVIAYWCTSASPSRDLLCYEPRLILLPAL